MIAAKETGQRHINDFIKERQETSQKRFWDPFPQLKILTFASLTKTSKANTSEEKAVSISADRDLFGHLITAAKSRAIDLKEVFSKELSPVLFAHKDGSLRKSGKSVLMSVLEETVTVLPHLPSDSAIPIALMVDGLAFIQKLRSGGAVNFGDLCVCYYRQLVNAFRRNRCSRIDVVFDTYRKVSIKSV